ncbi:ice-binding family protein [Halopseudomonas pelagia]|uniref:ice-binding family protein n=3 Tax=Halopseudomonas pelagia TaxID=553151 RepID=UPI0030DD2FC0|tara:strand:- start:30425 stop:31915 length:1491 start_codon:yes stop_codon:yes gene_type:complete
MKKSLPLARLLAISAILVSGLSLAGCFGSSGGSSNNDNTGGTTPPVATPLVPIAESDLVQAVRPISESITVDTNKKLAVTFNQDMDADTVNGSTFLLQGDTGPAIVGVVSYDAHTRTAIFIPDSGLTDDTLYTATLTTGVEDAAGAALEDDLSWQFTTGNTTDTVAPAAKFALLDGAVEVSISRNITATFSESIDPTTVTANSFTLETAGVSVDGVVSYTGSTAVFNPVDNLLPGTLYTATLTTMITDLANPANALPADQSVSFTTENSMLPAAGPDPVLLGTAGNFVMLSKTGITTTGVTEITGDIGVSPINEAAITGFSQARDATDTFSTSDLVTGKIYAADMASPTPIYLTTAISDMELAFNDAAGRSNPLVTELGAGDISGETLAPGLYKWGTGVSASSDFTFDGGPNDVWILQIDQDLLLETGVAVQLSGGAKAENIFWQVAGQATLRTGATLNGILLSKTQIVMQTGSTFNGRALAQTLVTLDAVIATQP